ncbi:MULTISPECIES: DUF6429 family protein, partial [Rhizobium]|uniref:DUF6429 family protein n=1 Tax=Rhizobium TaxID=379 RepID=UPI001482A791
MEIDEDKIDDAVLALLWLTLHNERCAWKGFDWATTDRLHRKSLIGDPVNKSKGIVNLIAIGDGLSRWPGFSLRREPFPTISSSLHLAVRDDGWREC